MKYCSKCGNRNADEAAFCMSCGTPLAQAPQSAGPDAPAPDAPQVDPAVQNYAQGYNQNYTPRGNVPPSGESNTSVVWLTLNIVITVLCCLTCVPLVFSIIGIVYANMGMSSFNRADYAQAKKHAKVSMIMFVIGVSLGLIITVAAVMCWPAVADWAARYSGSEWSRFYQ